MKPINLDDKCTKCGVMLRRQMFLAMMIDAGAQTLDPCICPKGGDHDFAQEDTSKLVSEGDIT